MIILIAAILLISSLLFAAGHPLSPSIFWLALAVMALATLLLCSRCFSTMTARSNPSVALQRWSKNSDVSAGFARWLGASRAFLISRQTHAEAKSSLTSRSWLASAGILAVLAAVLLFGIYVSGKYYDLSWDGQTYHQEGIIQLADGWNPFHDQPLQLVNSAWINHYAKGPWIAAASLYILTGHIEQGKVFNILLIVSSFFLCLSALLTHYRDRLLEPVLFSVLAAGNPVSILQATTFYNDGQLSSLLVIIIALLFLIVESPSAWPALTLALSVIIAVNIKFTALAYILALGLPVLLYLFLTKKWRPLRMLGLSFSIGLVAGLLFVGFNPYVTNTVRNGNPFYPLAGPHAVDIVKANSPAEFQTMNRFEKLFVSTFSETGNIDSSHSTHWKWPFTVDQKEVDSLWPDTRIAGFGPLFGGAVLLSPILLVTAWPHDKKKTLAYACLGLLIICSALVNSEAWWARYAPQLWLLPVLCAMLGLAMNSKPPKILGLAILLVLCLNLFLVSASYFAGQSKGCAILKSQLAEMKRAPLVLVSFRSMYSNRVRLTEAGIHYREVGRLEGPGVKTLDNSDTTYRED